MSMSSDDANVSLPDSAANHSEWSLRMRDPYCQELQRVKRQNQELKNAFDMSMRDYKLACDARNHAQGQLNLVKTELDSLKVHANKMESENNLYKQQHYESNDLLKKMFDEQADLNNTLKNQLEQYREMYEAQCDELSKMKQESNQVKASLSSQCTAAIQKWQNVVKEHMILEESHRSALLAKDELAKDLANLRKLKDHEAAVLRREKEELSKNHNLVMSERDNVHKEIDMLTERISSANSKVNQLEQDKRHNLDMIATYQHEIQSALQSRDDAQRHMRQLSDCVKEMLKESDNGDSMNSTLSLYLNQVAHQPNDTCEGEQMRYPAQQYEMKEAVNDSHSSKEVEMLKKEIASLRKELAEAKNEATISINRRDWAFSERDKIVQERESIRRQCDELRRERDRAVSNHAEELRTLDELKRFKIATDRELQEMREKLEKEERKNQLIGQSNSRDSAIDNDFQDWDTETLDFEIDVSGGYHTHTDLGIDISYGGGDASEASLYIHSIKGGSPCEGKLRLNDVLLRVNNVDVANATKETVMEALQVASNTVNLRVRRKKPVGRFNVSVDLTLNKRDPGLQLESGVYISRISPGSPLAKEGNIAVGDRVLSVNNKSVEHKSAKDVMKMIESSGDFVVLNVGKYGVMPTDSISSTSSNSGGTINLSLFEKAKQKLSRGGEKGLPKHSIDNGTGTTKRIKITNFLNKLKPRPNDDDDDESDTLKVRTENVIQILDEINRQHGDGTGTWPRGTEGVEVSTNGTVTVKPRPSHKPVIPETFVDHKQVYTRPRHNSGELRDSETRPSQHPHRHSYIPPSSSSSSGQSRSPVSSRRMVASPNQTTQLYEPRVQTLPNGPRRFVSNVTATKSASLPGGQHLFNSSHHQSAMKTSRTTDGRYSSKPFYPPGSTLSENNPTAESLDSKVQEIKNKYGSANGPPGRKNRPVSLQPQFGSKSMSPHDFDSRVPSSPRRKNRPFTPESPMSSSSYRFMDSSRPGSASSQPSATRSHSSGQMFFPAPSNPHKIIHPSCSPPPPYSATDKHMHSSPSSIAEDHLCHGERASPVPAYYNQSHTLDRKFAPGSSQMHHAVVVPVRPSSSTDYSQARVKFPSNHSVSSNRKSLNSNSLEIVSSGRSSPLTSPFSPDFYNRRSDEFISGSSSSRPNSGRSAKLKEGVLREVELDTSFDHLGIQIQEKPGTGIFITSVSHNSLAAEVGIAVDDQIIEFCGINMRTASIEHASSVLKSWRYDDEGKVKMTVQYNPRRCKKFPEQPKEVDKNSVTGSIQAIPAYNMENSGGAFQKKALNIVHSNGSSSDESRTERPRSIYTQRSTQEVGIRLIGGNQTGVFIANISPDSPCANTDLKIGDQILAINGKDLQHATAEQVATELNRPSESLHIKAQTDLNRYRMIQTAGAGDHFYVRAHFSYEAENQNEISIAHGDLLLVENSLLYGQIGKWYVSKIDERGNKVGSGIVPSRNKMEETYALRRSYSDVMPEEDSKSGRSRNGSIGRRSFFKRRSGRHQHQRSGSKDSRELTSFSDLSMNSDNVPIADDGAPLLYQRVEKIHCTDPRPVIILGPFAQALIQKLVHESHDKYVEYEGELLNTENTVIEKGIADGVFVNYRKVNDLFEVTRTHKLHEIANSNRHCLLMVHPSAVDRMHRCKLYPIVIYIKHKSLKQIREVKDPRFLPEHLSSKVAKESYEYFSRIEAEYKNTFTVEVQGSNMAAMHQNIKRVIDEEQVKHLWL